MLKTVMFLDVLSRRIKGASVSALEEDPAVRKGKEDHLLASGLSTPPQ